jgi:phosphoribosylanthranilate isomerase
MSVWIKICGNTSLADALLAVESGADALGFVFAPSPRQVTVQQAAAIISRLPANIEKIGVFVDAGQEEIVATCQSSGLTGVQLHFDAPPELPALLRGQLGAAARILRVLHFSAESADECAARFHRHAQEPHIDAILLDSRSARAVGGTGVAFDWQLARHSLQQLAPMRLVAAGGLNPANVAEAIATLRPWGVDAVSGVESAPGRKDPAKVREFVTRARAATNGSC